MPASKPVQASQTEVLEATTEFDPIPVSRKPHIVAMAPTYQGGLCILRSDGRMFERITDPAPRTTPGLPGKVWVEIEPPKV